MTVHCLKQLDAAATTSRSWSSPYSIVFTVLLDSLTCAQTLAQVRSKGVWEEEAVNYKQ